MKKAIMALEELNDDVTPPVEEPVEVASDEAVEADAEAGLREGAEIDADVDQVEEAEGIDAVLDTYEDTLEAPEALPEQTVDAVEVAVEHFCTRLGYAKKVVPAFEGFAGSPLDRQKEALANIQALRTQLHRNITIAQEGLMARLGNALQRAFTSMDSLDKKLGAVMGEIKSKGTKETGFEDAAWGRIFAASGKHQVGAADVERVLSHYTQEYRSKIISALKEGAELCDSMESALQKSWLVAKDTEVSKIKAMREQAAGLADKLGDYKHAGSRKAEVNMSALSANDAQKLGAAAQHVLQDKELRDAAATFKKRYEHLVDRFFKEANLRLVGDHASDVKAVRSVFDSGMGFVTNMLYDYNKALFQMVYGVYKYLNAAKA